MSEHPEKSVAVTWDPNDRDSPQNFSTTKKIVITVVLALLAEAASMGSSILSQSVPQYSTQFEVSQEIGLLATSLYVLGFAFGPLIWAPISEIWGRRVSLLPACFVLSLLSFGSARSPNICSLLLTRFLAGLFGSAPVSNVSAAIGDIWTARYRAIAGTFYALAVIGGPTVGPIIGGAITQSSLGWRWCEYVQAIWTLTVVVLATIFLPEIYAPVLLARKAARLRKTGIDAWHPHENILKTMTVKEIVTRQFTRPLTMLFTEPTVTFVALYASFTYSILYFTLEAFPIVYQEIRGYNPLVGSLPFLAILVGVLVSTVIILAGQGYYYRKLQMSAEESVPEARTPPMLVGAILLPIGLFWFAWTAGNSRIHWIVPTIAAVFVGAGFATVFQQCILVLIDTYGTYAASAVSGNTFLRSLMASGFSLAATPMIHTLGVGPALSIFGGLAVLTVPIPIVLKLYGKSLRARSRFLIT